VQRLGLEPGTFQLQQGKNLMLSSDSPAMGTRSKKVGGPASPAMGIRSKRRLSL